VVTEGIGSFVSPRYHNNIIALVDAHVDHEYDSRQALQHCGFEDTIVNHSLLLREIDESPGKQEDIDQYIEDAVLSKRAFTVQAVTNLRSVTLSMSDIDIIKTDFPKMTD
jgi:hypothetical protein